MDTNGNLNNFIIVQEQTEQKKETKVDSMMEDENEEDKWGQVEKTFVENKKNPPSLPPHLRYTPLNSTASKEDHDPSVVPTPLMVTLNHCYFNEGENIDAIGITTRYKEKFSTLVLYKPKK